MTELFAPPDNAWQGVSTRLRTLHRSLLCGAAVVGGVVLGVLAVVVLDRRWVLIPVTVGTVGAAAWAWWWSARRQRAWGYAERDDDLYIVHGIMWRRLVVVPYGRMQFVDVRSGPLERAFGIATVKLHTASPSTTAVIPGLERAEALRLRDRLTELGESRAAGL
jgi:membrane protein YdbS with pleckstrin-like domain